MYRLIEETQRYNNACVLSIIAIKIMNAQMTFMLNQKWHMNEGKMQWKYENALVWCMSNGIILLL